MECHDEDLPSVVNVPVNPEKIEKTPTADKDFLNNYLISSCIFTINSKIWDGMGWDLRSNRD